MQLVLASNNTGKLNELQNMLHGLDIALLAQNTLGVPEAPEPFDTFIENALAKARHAARHAGLPALADDAGLCLDVWGGKPGVHTAHFCEQYGLPKSNENNVSALLQALHGEQQRTAAMVSTLVALRSFDDPEPLIAVGRIRGTITTERMGEGGFGFDPVFFIPEQGKTFAQMDVREKNQLSHRGRACALMRQLIAAHWLHQSVGVTACPVPNPHA